MNLDHRGKKITTLFWYKDTLQKSKQSRILDKNFICGLMFFFCYFDVLKQSREPLAHTAKKMAQFASAVYSRTVFSY